MATTATIRFADPNTRLPGERRSKLIDPNSPLYHHLESEREKLSKIGLSDKRMDFHVELFGKNEQATEEALVRRCKCLEGQSFVPEKKRLGHAIVYVLPKVLGFWGVPHITLAHYVDRACLDQAIEDAWQPLEKEEGMAPADQSFGSWIFSRIQQWWQGRTTRVSPENAPEVEAALP